MNRLRLAALLALLPAAAAAQTANGAPVSPGLVGTSPPVSRTAPSVGRSRRGAGTGVQQPLGQPLPKPTAAERAEQRKLARDLHICIGC